MIKVPDVLVKNAEAIGAVIIAAVGGFFAGANKDKIKKAFKRNGTKKKGTKKRKTKARRSNSRTASGNRKASAKKVVKKTATRKKKEQVGEKTPEIKS